MLTMQIFKYFPACLLLLCDVIKLTLLLPTSKILTNSPQNYNPEENEGSDQFLAEGDILVDREQYYSMLGQGWQRESGNYQRDSRIKGRNRRRKRQRRNIDSVFHSLWLNRTIPYIFDKNFGSERRKVVESAMLTLERVSCIHFKERKDERDYVYVLPDTRGCYSNVGRSGGLQKLGLHSKCEYGNIVHELMHVLGHWHEHNRKDRDEFITVLYQNIRPDKKDGFNISVGKNQESILELPYDYGSIMHYANTTFSVNPLKLLTLKPKKALPPGVVMGQRIGPSNLDVKKLNTLYMCDIRECAHPGLIRNGNISGLKFTVGSTISYSCRPGYTLVGAPERICLTVGQWSANVPACVSSHSVHYCNFDNSQEPFCGWEQSKDDDGIEWTRLKGSTFSPDTGPYWDNTVNTPSGFYVYMEATKKFKGATSKLRSPEFEPTGHQMCLVFFAYMHGKNMGSLLVYKQDSNDTNSNSKTETVYALHGEQGDRWNQVFLVLGSPTKSFYIILEAIVGNGFASDIAIDDVIVGPCKDFKAVALSGGLNRIMSCTFDNNNICNFLQARDDDTNWLLITGSTPTFNTGPVCDPVHCDTGRYLYLEASMPRREGDTAILKTPVLGGNGTGCLTFYYHMYGTDVGALSVKMTSVISGNVYNLWVKHGDQGNRWYKQNLNFNALEAYELTFEGIVGKRYKGDIAIDNIAITQGRCTGVMNFNCSFEHDMCGWTNALPPVDTKDWTRFSGQTDTPYTGPSGDRNRQDGHYLYVEASRSFNDDSARLISPAVRQTQTGSCLSFWYHMLGSMQGNLTVYIQSELGQEEVVWTTSGDHGDTWLSQNLTVKTFPFQYTHIIFELKLNGYRGDTALDDVTISTGVCDSQR